MKISKKDALSWFEFFAALPGDEEIAPRQMEIAYAAFAQIEAEVDRRNDQIAGGIKGLKNLKGRTFYIGDDEKFPQGCRSCLLGTGLGAIRKTNRCNAKCRFCYDYGVMDDIPPIGEGLWEIGGTKFYEKDLELLFSVDNKPTGVSYVYLEPFMEIEKYYSVIEKFAREGIHQHLYTNGISATEEQLKALSDAGLDEIRFNLGASSCSDKVIENIAAAKRHIGQVGIETPMTREFFDGFMKKKKAVLDTGLDFINCAEMHLNPNNIANYAGENLYMCRLGYVSPIWSRNLTLRFMAAADDERWPVAVHDCSNRTKFARDLNLRAKEGGWFGASAYACEFERLPFEYFLPVLRDESFAFIEEEELPDGYRPGQMVF